MTGISREGFQAKQEDDNNINIVNKLTTAISTSRSWSGFRNPRIVRVSRSFGGKDRHSKVYTIRGLRDRRIRLSVTTAIQLYDLQDRLNLSQPSKVIDWLLEVTKRDIDKLPPLQMPQGFAQFYQQTLLPHHHHVHEPSGNFSHESSLGPNFYGANATFFKGPRYWERDNTLSRLKEKQEDEEVGSIEKGKWVFKTNDQENEDGNHGIGGNYSSSQVSAAQKLFPIFGTSHSSLLSGMISGNNAMAYNSIHHISEPNSNLSLMPHSGSYGLFSSQVDNSQQSGGNGVQIPSGYSQFLFCPPNSAATPSLFGPYSSNITASSAESEPTRSSQSNHIQFLSSASHPHHIPIIPSMFSFKRLDSDHNNDRTQSNHRNGADRS